MGYFVKIDESYIDDPYYRYRNFDSKEEFLEWKEEYGGYIDEEDSNLYYRDEDGELIELHEDDGYQQEFISDRWDEMQSEYEDSMQDASEDELGFDPLFYDWGETEDDELPF